MKEFVEPLEKALGRVQDSALFLMQNAMKNPDEAGGAATDLLRLMALTAMAYMWNRIVVAAHKGLAAGNDNSFDLSLPNAEPGATISYQRWNGASWDTFANSTQTDLADGNYRYRATATDAAGNIATSAELPVAIDRTAPGAPTLALNNGVSEPLSRAQLTASNGALLVTSAESGATVTVTLTSDAQGSSTVIKSFTSSGSTQSVVFTSTDAAVLGDGALTATATISDPAGNISSAVPLIFNYVAQPVAILGELSISSIQNGAEAGPLPSIFQVTRTGDTSAALTINYSLSGTAVGGVDYTLPTLNADGLGSITFAAGSNITTISLPTIDNQIRNTASRTISASLVKPETYSFVANQSKASASLIDNETDIVVPVISTRDLSFVEGSAGNWTASLDVMLSQITTVPVSVNYSFAGPTATATGSGSDYSGTSGTLTWAPGTLKQTITFTIVADSAVEVDEVFFINLDGASGATFSNRGTSLSSKISLLNDDFNAPQDPNAGLTLTLSSAGSLTGTALNDTLNGSSGADNLNGAGGIDVLIGGRGADIVVSLFSACLGSVCVFPLEGGGWRAGGRGMQSR